MILEIVRLIGHTEPQQAFFWPLLVAGAVEGYRFYQGSKQKKEAAAFANKPRPVSNVPIPPSALENERLAKDSYGVSGLPGQGYYENQLDRSVQSGARNLIETGHGADTAAGIAALENSKMNAIEGMGADAAKLKLSKLATLMGANSELAGFENAKYQTDWNWNQRDPYLQAMAAASALKNAGDANQFNAISNISTLAAGAMSYGGYGNGGNRNATTPPPADNTPVDLSNQSQYQFNTTEGDILNEQDLMNNSQAAVNYNNDLRLQQLRDKFLPLGFTEQQIQQMFASTQIP